MNIGLVFKKRKRLPERLREFTSTMSIPMTVARPSVDKDKKKKKLEEAHPKKKSWWKF
jgi:hypothetical protein